MYVSNTDVDNQDLTNFLGQVEIGDGLYLQRQDDSAVWQYWAVDAISSESGYQKYTISLIDSSPSAALDNNRKVLVSVRPGAAIVDQLQKQNNNANAQSPDIYTPDSPDYAYVYDITAKEWKLSTLQGIGDAIRLFAFVRGAITQAFTTTTSYQALPLWNVNDADHIYSSTANISIANATEINVNIPVRYRVLFIGSMTAASNDDFDFAFLIDGVAFPLQKDTSRSGDGAGNTVSFSVEGVTPLLTPGPHKLAIGAKNGGDTILSLEGSLSIDFAGND